MQRCICHPNNPTEIIKHSNIKECPLSTCTIALAVFFHLYASENVFFLIFLFSSGIHWCCSTNKFSPLVRTSWLWTVMRSAGKVLPFFYLKCVHVLVSIWSLFIDWTNRIVKEQIWTVNVDIWMDCTTKKCECWSTTDRANAARWIVPIGNSKSRSEPSTGRKSDKRWSLFAQRSMDHISRCPLLVERVCRFLHLKYEQKWKGANMLTKVCFYTW